VWSSDGTRIAFSSRRNGKLDLYQKPVNSDNEELLLKTDENKLPESWSRSGFLLYEVGSEKQKNDIWVLPLNGDKKVFPFLATEFNETAARFSPDDRWVAYESDESGRAEVYVRAFTPPSTSGAPVAGVKLLVSTTGGRTPRWPRNGKELFYLSLDGKVMAVDVTLSPTFHVGTPHSLFQAPRVSNNAVLWDVTSDGKRFLFAAPSTEEDATVPYTVVLNWQASLK
jgi:Tol biopolymer transport system component